MSTEPAEIARWMIDEFEKSGRLVQTRAARLIRARFGEAHVYKNKNHNWAIKPEILEEFRRLTPDEVVWSRSRQLWRRRRPGDPADTRMVR